MLKRNLNIILSKSGLYTLKIWLVEKLLPTYEIRENMKLESARIKFYKNFLSKNDLVFDVGANWGNRTDIFLKLGCRVVAFEPQVICSNYLKNKYKFKKCVVNQCGLGDCNEIKKFNISETNAISTFSDDFIEKTKDRFNKKWIGSTYVPIRILDSVINEYGIPKFIKIDVEGYEYQVLKGLTQKIKYICFEFTLPELIIDLLNCLNQIQNLGNFSCNLIVGEETSFFFPNWIHKDELILFLEKYKTNNITWGDIYIKMTDETEN